jgi:hypothetical protein
MTKEHPARQPKFAIVTLPRCGSYHLVSLLNSAPDIVCHGEVFKRDVVELQPRHLERMGVTPEDSAERDANPIAFLQRLRGLNARKVFGFKLFPEHASRVPQLGGQVLRNSGWRKIFLRRHPIESYASLLRARQTNVWTVRTTAATPPSQDRLHERVTFAPQTFDAHMKLVGWFEELLSSVEAVPNNPVVTVDYADVVDRSALPWLLRYVGSEGVAESLTSDFERQYTAGLSEGFTNWEELVAYAQQHGHAAMFAEPA